MNSVYSVTLCQESGMAEGGDPVTVEPVAPQTRADIPEVVKAVVAALATTKNKELGKS